MVGRILIGIPVLLLFAVTSVVFMAARAPRTWATHWTAPQTLATARGEGEYGAVPNPGGGWDLLWFDDDNQRLIFAPSRQADRAASPLVIQSGEIQQPTLLRMAGYEIGAWVRNWNGGSDLMAAILEPAAARRVFRLVGGSQPIEHPYLFAGKSHTADVVFSWQRPGAFQVFLLSLRPGATRPSNLKQLTQSQFYAFYPRAVTDRQGDIHLLYLDLCCHQQTWTVQYRRFDSAGRPLGKATAVADLTELSLSSAMPSQWGEEMLRGPGGDIWGAFTADGGIRVLKASQQGRILGSHLVDAEGEQPGSLALTVATPGGLLFWVQTFDLGSFLDSRRFDSNGRANGSSERAVYESAAQTNIRAAMVHGRPEVLWQAITAGTTSHFEVARFRSGVQPTLAQRLGLGLANPLQDLAVLLIAALSIAMLTTMGNILTVFGLAALGFFAMQLLRRAPGRWIVYALLLTAALYLLFVTPGGPILFLSTMPSLGLTIIPFGLLAAGGALVLILWLGGVAFRRVEDLYRVGLMAVFGVYFFAFIEAIVFIQQRLGYI